MLLFAKVTQYCFCSISILLTGLFALSLSGFSWSALELNGFSAGSLLAALLFLLIGCSIDVGKYLFWIHRDESIYYSTISIVLMLFSLLASCAFFYSAENDALENAETNFSQAEEVNSKIIALEEEIKQQEQLLNLRLSSKYHSQWEKADENAARIQEINSKINALVDQASKEKVDSVQKKIVVTNFFSSVGNIFSLEIGVVRGIGYTLLSLFLEISSLGALSLATGLQKNQDTESTNTNNKVKEVDAENEGQIERQIDKLINDIITGKTEPVLRTITKLDYGLTLDEIRQVLNDLCRARVLVRGKRNIYILKNSSHTT